jgi:uncharacterized protein
MRRAASRGCCIPWPKFAVAMTREQLAEAAGMTGNIATFDTYISRLRSLELVEGRGELRASEELFG